MKKNYDAPILELLAFMSDTAIGTEWSDPTEGDAIESQPWNDGELGGWT